ncbi:hypothetical protein [Aureimonas leprariae]|uniref:Uncharacterized protein n=1 Tax=Plantimonas leprariae TaxID=2615207 RepID=A0A7V7PK56_9HYPH|nr:hypothetical protein [Aureimonas leprariae]KAB0676001.1 hypothetical protein F6X38_22325 [Aureimonas leprariae]
MSRGDLRGVFVRMALGERRLDDAARMIAEALRSSEPLADDLRALIADMVDPDGKGDVRLKLGKRGRGRFAKPAWIEIAQAVEAAEEDMPTEAAVASVRDRFKRGSRPLARSTVFAAMSRYKEGRAAGRSVEEEERDDFLSIEWDD